MSTPSRCEWRDYKNFKRLSRLLSYLFFCHDSIVVNIGSVPDLVNDDMFALLSNPRLVGSLGLTVSDKAESVLKKYFSKNLGLDFGTARDDGERAS